MLERGTGERVRKYFSVKRQQLLAMRELPICQHNGLSGGHREELHRLYLSEILPSRFGIERGMVYGPIHRSHEADIVIWDAANYPRLPMLDHSFFFAESVRLVLECKSNWSTSEFADVQKKVEAVRDIMSNFAPSIRDEIEDIQLALAAIQNGTSPPGRLISRPKIGTASVFLKGGHAFVEEFGQYSDDMHIERTWPDALLMLDPGYVVLKRNHRGGGRLEFYDIGEDCLLLFTSELLQLAMERIVQVEAPFNLIDYSGDLRGIEPTKVVDFRSYLLSPGSYSLWDKEPEVAEYPDDSQ